MDGIERESLQGGEMKSAPIKATTRAIPAKAASNPALPSPAIPPQALPSQAFPRNMFSTAATKNIDDGGWQEVKKRYRFPSHWRSSQPSNKMVKPYAPYSRKTSYAQVVQNKPFSPRSPTAQQETYYYVSPHSPTNLRFPPSPHFPEWRGRCFKCCRTGHSVASCRFQRKCGKCWSNGHIGTNCTKSVAPTATEVPTPSWHFEPGFDELLADLKPYPPALMPEGRPQKVDCFIERDEDYFIEFEALSKAVVVHNISVQSGDNILNYAVKTRLVTKDDIQISALLGSKYLIRLPPTVSTEAFIKATPYEAWEEGLSFQHWTPLEEAATVIPRFKILLELIGVPPLLWRERQIVKAVSQFGVFLGTMEQEDDSSLEAWMVEVGTDDLAKIPHTIAMHVGGMQFPVGVRPLTWKRSVLYKAEDFPTLPSKFSGPSIPAPTMKSGEKGRGTDEIFSINKSALMEVCKGKYPGELPLELRRFAIHVW